MDHFAGLDVSVKETSICIVDDAGNVPVCVPPSGTAGVGMHGATRPPPHLDPTPTPRRENHDQGNARRIPSRRSSCHR